MIRTQIYLPEEIHVSLLTLAKKQGSTLSQLIRKGAAHVLKDYYGGVNPSYKAKSFFTNPPTAYKLKLSKTADELVRKERD